MNISDRIKSEVQKVAATLVNEVLEAVEGLHTLRAETSEDQKDGVDEEISMELDRLMFHNVRLDIPGMPSEGLAAMAGALARELWKEEVNSLLDQYERQDPEYPIHFRLSK